MSEAGFGDRVDCAVNLNGGKVYFFRGDSYVRYDVLADKVDAGYPLRITDQWHGLASDRVDGGYPLRVQDHWPGLLSALGGRVRAVTDLYVESETWLPGASLELPPNGGGVLHTTEGTTMSGALETFLVHNSWPHLTIDPKHRHGVAALPVERRLPVTQGRPDTDEPTALRPGDGHGRRRARAPPGPALTGGSR